MEVVIYRGPKAEGDPGTVYRIPHPDGDVVLQREVPYPVDKLPDGVLDELTSDDEDSPHRAHIFEVGDELPPEPYGGYRQKSAEQIVSDLRNTEPSTAKRMAEAILDSDEQRVTVIEAAEAITGAAEDREAISGAEARETLPEPEAEEAEGEEGEGVSEAGE